MKTIKKALIALFATVFALETLFVLLYAADQISCVPLEETVCARICEQTGVVLDAEDHTVLLHHDCHGGFHGDGCQVTFIEPNYDAAPFAVPDRWSYVEVPANGVLEFIVECGGFGSDDFYLNHGRVGMFDRAYFVHDDQERKWYNYSLYLYDEETGIIALYRSDI